MAKTDAELTAELAPAGVRFLQRDAAQVRVPWAVAGLAPGCRPEDGRLDGHADEVVDYQDPQRVATLNAGWFRLAHAAGLFDQDLRFLLGVSYGDPDSDEPLHGWAQVQLLDYWNLVGSDVRQLISHDGTAEFTALSLDNRVLVRMTLWSDMTVSSLAIIDPDQAEPLRRYAARMTTDELYSVDERQAASRWLAAYPLGVHGGDGWMELLSCAGTVVGVGSELGRISAAQGALGRIFPPELVSYLLAVDGVYDEDGQ